MRFSLSRRRATPALAAALLALAAGAPALGAQTPNPARADTSRSPAVGALAPDFALPGATRYGLLRAPVRLSDFRGKTVVLAFFIRARTKG